jgi:hypothetical protein
MQIFLKFALVLLSAGLVLANDGAKEAPGELVIKTTYLPPNCPEQAKRGDGIKVHYV